MVVLIHGSSDDGASIHPLAKALHETGATIYVPVIRAISIPAAAVISIISANSKAISPILWRYLDHFSRTLAFP